MRRIDWVRNFFSIFLLAVSLFSLPVPAAAAVTSAGTSAGTSAVTAAVTAADDKLLDVSRTSVESVTLTEYFAVYQDPSRLLTINDIRKPEVAAAFKSGHPPGDALGFAYTDSAIWLRLRLANSSRQTVERMLEIAHPLLGEVDFYRPENERGIAHIATGYTRPFTNRPHQSRYFALPVSLPPASEQMIYIRVASANTVSVPARLWEPTAFAAKERNDYLLQAGYFGLVISILLYNIMLYLVLRDRNYLMYLAFAGFCALTLTALTGLGAEFVWPGVPLLSKIGTNLGLSGATVALILFMRRMIDTPRLGPRWLDRVLLFLVLLNAVFFVLMIVRFESVARVFTAITVPGFFVLMLAGAWYAYQRNRSAYFFVIAFFLVLSATIMAQLRALGYLPSNALTTSGTQLGSALEMLLLSFALADRFNSIRKENAIAQREKLAAQDRLVESLKTSERQLEERVEARTAELQVLNNQLEALSATDGLTGIANRRRFDEVLAQEWQLAARNGEPLAVALMDVDWFKKYNDHYGHLAGDECLRTVAGVLTGAVRRKEDLLARYGGEEFAFIARGAEGATALTLARNFCEAVRLLELPHAMSPLGCVTISVGVAVLVPDSAALPSALVQRADEALYRAKEQGRDGAVMADPASL